MKKFILGLVFALLCFVTVNAQTYVDNGKFTDNVYVGASIGGNVWNDHTRWVTNKTEDSWRVNPTAEIYVGKMFTPYVGTELNYSADFRKHGVWLDYQKISANAVLNLSNCIAGYNGNRRKVDVEGILGTGWVHNYNAHTNSIEVRGAVRTNFNVSKNYAVTLTPEYTYSPKGFGNPSHYQSVNLYVGVKYNIPTKRSGFKSARLYDEAEVSDLESQISKLTAELAKKPATVEVHDTVYAEPKVTKESFTVNFEKCGANIISFDESVISYIKDSGKHITITGSASPEGTEKINVTLGKLRADSVKEALVKAGVNPDLIEIKQDYESLRNAIITISE